MVVIIVVVWIRPVDSLHIRCVTTFLHRMMNSKERLKAVISVLHHIILRREKLEKKNRLCKSRKTRREAPYKESDGKHRR